MPARQTAELYRVSEPPPLRPATDSALAVAELHALLLAQTRELNALLARLTTRLDKLEGVSG